jgi:c-di-GMP-binding flagellar brake protein YcgR
VADRRQRVRFEIVGRLPGSITTAATVQVHNLSRGGVLVRSHWPLNVDGLHTVRLGLLDEFSTLQARVRHVRRAPASDDYLIGLEFIDAEPRAAAQLERLATSDAPSAAAHLP